MKIALVLALTAAVGLSGCQTAPADRALVAAGDYGPFPDNYKELVSTYWRPLLKDPYSAQYHYAGEPFKCYMREAPISGGKPRLFGWCTMYSMNAKNSYGAYIGEKDYRFFIKDSRTRPFDANPWFDEPWYKK